MRRLLRVLWLAPACVLAAGCPEETGDDGATSTTGTPPDAPPAWQVVFSDTDLDRALLSVFGFAPNDVYAVGGSLGNGRPALALHFDGTVFRELDPGGEETYWWVHGSSPTDVWMVGTEGRISHFDGTSFEEHTSGTSATLWGVMAFGPDDAWAVGGSPGGGIEEPNDIVLRWDGAAWTPEALPGEPLGRSLFKVWGTSSDDLYVVGEAGTIWHRKDGGWTLESDPPLATGTLFTVAGCSSDEVYAVGGQDVLLRSNGSWAKLDVALSNLVNGVACSAPDAVALVGFGGLKQRFVDGAWIDEFTKEPFADLHATWAESAGVYWAVGGNFVTQPMPDAARAGVIARYGPGSIPTTLE